MAAHLPGNATVSSHPCLRAKLSKLRSSQTTSARDIKALVNDIAIIVGCEAFAKTLKVEPSGKDASPLGYAFDIEKLSPSHLSLMPIMRSGLAMVDAIQSLLPEPVPVHHLGLFRDTTTMSAVEYYNNLPYHVQSKSNPKGEGPSELTILVDPIIATGATACAAIDTLREWGVKRIVLISVLVSRTGLARAAGQWPEGVEVWAGGMDEETDNRGMIKPGLGDIGDRLYMTIGK